MTPTKVLKEQSPLVEGEVSVYQGRDLVRDSSVIFAGMRHKGTLRSNINKKEGESTEATEFKTERRES